MRHLYRAGRPHSSLSCLLSVYFVLYGRPHLEQWNIVDALLYTSGSQNRAAANTVCVHETVHIYTNHTWNATKKKK